MILVMVGISIFSGIWVNKRCGEMSDTAVTIMQAYNEGDREKALAEAEKLENEWEDFRGKASVLLKYDKLYETDRLTSHIEVMVRNDSDEVMQQMAELVHMLDILRKNETPILSSVF